MLLPKSRPQTGVALKLMPAHAHCALHTAAGHSVVNDLAGARSKLGLCPQFDILFDSLTVKEHLCVSVKSSGLVAGTSHSFN